MPWKNSKGAQVVSDTDRPGVSWGYPSLGGQPHTPGLPPLHPSTSVGGKIILRFCKNKGILHLPSCADPTRPRVPGTLRTLTPALFQNSSGTTSPARVSVSSVKQHTYSHPGLLFETKKKSLSPTCTISLHFQPTKSNSFRFMNNTEKKKVNLIILFHFKMMCLHSQLSLN